MCHYVPLSFAIFEAASWFHPPRSWHLSAWWTCLSGCYSLLENWSSAHSENFVGIKISSNTKVQGHGEYGMCHMTFQLSCIDFWWVYKLMWGLALSCWKTTNFQLANYRHFSSIAGVNKSRWEMYLFELIT